MIIVMIRAMDRRVGTQDVSWFLDLHRRKQLNLDPPYQRKSVWTKSDRLFFLDTVFRGYPTGVIFLHKSLDEQGAVAYNVVDGKQRLETILLFANDELKISNDFGNRELNNKKFTGLSGDHKRAFWNYVFTVEQFERFEGSTVNDIFDRLNRNTLKLTKQELRHAQFEGEFIKFVEADVEIHFWTEMGISTKTRARRMKDTEFVAELFILTINGVIGSDADTLDEFFGKYDEEIPDADENKQKFESAKKQISSLNERFNIKESRFKNFADFYGLFAAVLQNLPSEIDATQTADNLRSFEGRLQEFIDNNGNLKTENENEYIDDADIAKYERAVRGASSDSGPREQRTEVISKLLVVKLPNEDC